MLPFEVSASRFSDTAGRQMYRHSLSSLSRWCASADTAACSEKNRILQ
jgi:hypothetical protein